MKFEQSLLTNPVFTQQWIAFDNLRNEMYGAESALLKDNGDWEFCFHAPEASSVRIVPLKGKEIVAQKKENGKFVCCLPYDDHFTGPRNIDVYVDDTLVIWPGLPVFWSFGRLCNYVEIPDEELEFSYLKDVPHGAICQEIYYSRAAGMWRRCMVYTPPGYMKSSEEYPVLYLQHGSGENETVWESTGHIGNIMDNLLAEKKCRPFLIVMNNGMIRDPKTGTQYARDGLLEEILLKDCIPFIEQTYRAKTDKWNRAIGGLSMGAYQTTEIAFRNLDKFCALGCVTGMMYQPESQSTFHIDWKEMLADSERIKKELNVLFQSATPQEDHLDFVMIDHQLRCEAGLDTMPGYRLVVHDERMSKWASWKIGIRDYLSMLFQNS